jgi:hypothetical protein
MVGDTMPPSATVLALALMTTWTISSRRVSSQNSRQTCPRWLPWSVLAALTVGSAILGFVHPDAMVAAYNENYLFPG